MLIFCPDACNILNGWGLLGMLRGMMMGSHRVIFPYTFYHATMNTISTCVHVHRTVHGFELWRQESKTLVNPKYYTLACEPTLNPNVFTLQCLQTEMLRI